MEQEFSARKGSHINDSQAQSYGEELYKLMRRLGRKEVTPQELVKDAKRKTSAYHDFFEWDDTKAGYEYRLAQARTLMGSIVRRKVIVEKQEPVEVRVFHNIEKEDASTIKDEKKSVYMVEEEVFENEEYSKQVIGKALGQLLGWVRRHKTYEQLAGLRKTITKTLKKLNEELELELELEDL